MPFTVSSYRLWPCPFEYKNCTRTSQRKYVLCCAETYIRILNLHPRSLVHGRRKYILKCLSL